MQAYPQRVQVGKTEVSFCKVRWSFAPLSLCPFDAISDSSTVLPASACIHAWIARVAWTTFYGLTGCMDYDVWHCGNGGKDDARRFWLVI